MTKNYFRTLFNCVLFSFLFLCAATYLKLAPWFTMLGGIVPLVYYHIGYLRPQAKHGLTQTAIDSVYYFGFLVTIAALGISAIAIAKDGNTENVGTVVFQFGIGLFATGYAVIARMHLSSISSMVEEASPEAIMDRYVKRSMELVTNVEMASTQLVEFSKNLMVQTSEVTETARLTTEKSMLEIARVFEQEMKSTLAIARDGLTEIRGLVADTSFVAEREELARSIKATIEGVTKLNKALDDLTAKSRQGAQATQQNIATWASFDETLRKFALKIDDLGGEKGALVKSAETLRTTSAVIADCNTAMSTAVTSLSGIASVVADTGPTFKNMRTLTKKATEQLDGLASASAKLDTALSTMTEAAVASDSLAVGMAKVTASLSPLAVNAEALTARFEGAGSASARLEEHLSVLPKHTDALREMGDEVTEALDAICEALEEAVKHAKTLSARTSESSMSFEAANQLLESAATLKNSVSSVQDVFASLANSVSETQKVLSESSDGIKASISTSTQALEADAQRSAQAVTLLTERLVQVAQNIIDKTRQPETVG